MYITKGTFSNNINDAKANSLCNIITK
jgi:hypothetical protein